MRKITKNKRQNKYCSQYFQEAKQQKIKSLVPKAYLQLDDVSLVCKYSPQNPNILIATDDTGAVNFIKTDKIEQYSNQNSTLQIQPYNKYYVHSAQILDVDWHDNSQKLLVGSGDRRCQMIDVETGKIIIEDFIHDNSVRCIKSCQYNSNLFVSGARDGKMILWDIRQQNRTNYNYNYLIEMGEPEVQSFTGTTFYQDQNTLLTCQAGENNLKIWDLRKTLNSQPKWTEKGGKKIKKQFDQTSNKYQSNQLLMEFNDQTANQYNLRNLQQEMEHLQQQLQNEKMNPNYNFNNAYQQQQTISKNYKLNLMERYTELIQKISPPKQQKENKLKGFTSMVLSKSEQKLLVNSIDNTIHMYKTDQIQNKGPQIFQGHKNNYYSKLQISPCEQFIISGSVDYAMFIWDINSQQQQQKFNYNDQQQQTNNVEPVAIFDNVHQGEINCVDWSSQNYNFIASVGDDKMLYIWDYGSFN